MKFILVVSEISQCSTGVLTLLNRLMKNVVWMMFNLSLLCLTVNKWRGDAAVDEFDRCNAAIQSGFDEMSYAGDPRRFVEVVAYFFSDCIIC